MNGNNNHNPPPNRGRGKRTIEVVVRPDGGLTIEAAGYTGADCEAATAFLEEALGLLQQRDYKPQYYAKPRTRNRNLNEQEVKS